MRALRSDERATGLPPELLEMARAGDRPLPFIGAGLAVDAGVPSAWQFGREMAAEAELALGQDEDLDSIVAQLIERDDDPSAPDRVARVVLDRLQIRPTRTLTAIASGCGGRHILTTNYD